MLRSACDKGDIAPQGRIRKEFSWDCGAGLIVQAQLPEPVAADSVALMLGS